MKPKSPLPSEPVPFGDCIIKIAQLESKLAEIDRDQETEHYEKTNRELEAAYRELADKAMTKVEGWKAGPIIKTRHINSTDLTL